MNSFIGYFTISECLAARGPPGCPRPPHLLKLGKSPCPCPNQQIWLEPSQASKRTMA